MANHFMLYVDDTSPSITYYPFADTFGVPDQFSGWNPYYSQSGFTTSPNQTGRGDSLHLTSLDGASFSVKWSGIGIQLFGSCSQATYDITLDETYIQSYSSSPIDNLLAEFYDLSDADHTLTLTVHTNTPPAPDSYIAFDKAAIVSAPGPGDNSSTVFTHTADNDDIAFLGQWSYIYAAGENGHNHSFHQSTHAGDRFEFTFQGRIVTLYGLVSADSGQYSVTLDNETTTLSARSSSFYPQALLFYATDLDDHTEHQLVVQNEENHILSVGGRGLNYTSFLPSTSLSISSPAITSGTKAAISLACVLSFLLLLIFLCYFFIYRPRVRRNNTESSQVQREKEAEAGIAGVLNISADARALARRDSGGTSFGFAGFRLGTRSQRTNSVDIDIDSYGSWRSFKRGARRTRIGRHSQWDTYTVDLPSLSSNASQPSFRNQRERFPSQSSLRPPRSPKLSFGNRSAHARLGGGAHLFSNWGMQDDEENDNASAKIDDVDYCPAVESTLSPRTSVAHFLTGIMTPLRSLDGGEHGIQSQLNSHTRSPENLYLDIQEGSPFRVDFLGIGGSRDNGSGTENSPLPQVHSQMEPVRQEQRQEQDSRNERPRRISQVKFDTSGPPPPYPKLSFLDFGSSISNDASSSSQRSEREKSRWSATTAPSQAPSAPNTESSSASNSIQFDLPPIPPSPLLMQRSSSFSFPVSIPHSPHHLQVPSISRSSRRHSSGPIPGQLPSLSVPSSACYPESPSASPTDSVPVSVSDILFRHMNTSDGVSHRTSEGSQLPPHPPLPHSNESSPEPQPTSLIVQKLLGLSARHDQSSSGQNFIPEPPAVTPREPEPETSTPFMQRVLGFGAIALNPRHRNPSRTSTSSPKSSKLEEARK